MRVYFVNTSDIIESRSVEDAYKRIEREDFLTRFFTDEDKALKYYENCVKKCKEPRKLAYKLYWFSGAMIKFADGCDEMDDLEESFYTGTHFELLNEFVQTWKQE